MSTCYVHFVTVSTLQGTSDGKTCRIFGFVYDGVVSGGGGCGDCGVGGGGGGGGGYGGGGGVYYLLLVVLRQLYL